MSQSSSISLLFVYVLLGLIPALIVKGKGRNFFLWWFYGFAIFIVAIIHALVIKPKPKDTESADTASQLGQPTAPPVSGVMADEEYQKVRGRLLSRSSESGVLTSSQLTELENAIRDDRTSVMHKINDDPVRYALVAAESHDSQLEPGVTSGDAQGGRTLWALGDEQALPITEYLYETINRFDHGVAMATRAGKWLMLDLDGRESPLGSNLLVRSDFCNASVKGTHCPKCGNTDLKYMGTKKLGVGTACLYGALGGSRIIAQKYSDAEHRDEFDLKPLGWRCKANGCKNEFYELPSGAGVSEVMPVPCEVTLN